MPLVMLVLALTAALPVQAERRPAVPASPGIVSMARGDDPASATTSFFIVTAAAPTLDGKDTVFGRVIDGLDVLDRIESTPVSGESPTTRIGLIKVRIAG